MARIAPPRLFALLAAGIAAFALTLTGMGPASALAPPTETSTSGTVNYVNLGDSYSAGFGSGALVPGPFPGCFQGNGPTHVTKIAAMDNMNLTMDAACAGMTTTQIAAVIPAIAPYLSTADLTTLTLGGNNLGFGQIVFACSTMGSDAACENALEVATAILPAVTSSAHKTLQLLDAATPGEILVLGYPRLFTTSNGDQPLVTARNAREMNKVGDALDRAIRSAVKGTSATFVPVLGPFNDHGVGATDTWMYFNLANPADPFNLHPTTTGYLNGYYPAVSNRIHMNQLVR
ncbi:GDSL-type esterase/lipase family protein [Paeniglutamicibacter psychrophenolicus]|uniref:GDSL-type esterase/lipase family protein n=1 Tax=Paeniglutamicibacter psychrophenolicus TaxID=257454 RepID=UPI0027848ECB|nr:GDSL-type esterase/lipase family protein [Paeniglutamicibacter psychrophenolicus]MDQ0094657.1 lysophospholipase L1-like esterase [Paeniglutamicibacter psychrophenolicus]